MLERLIHVAVELAPEVFEVFVADYCAWGDCTPAKLAGKSHLALIDGTADAPEGWSLPFTIGLCAGDQAGRRDFARWLRPVLLRFAEEPQWVRCASGEHFDGPP